jgi:hypothetical protein
MEIFVEIVYWIFGIFGEAVIGRLQEWRDCRRMERQSKAREQSTIENALLRPCTRNLEANGHLLRPVEKEECHSALFHTP